jgi:hypothetical protein
MASIIAGLFVGLLFIFGSVALINYGLTFEENGRVLAAIYVTAGVMTAVGMDTISKGFKERNKDTEEVE